MANQGSYGIQILVDGAVLPEIRKDGRTYIAAPSDRDFEIRIFAPSWERTEAVLSVDGLSVMSGKNATIDEGGYVVTRSANITGFRLNDDEVAKFRFGKRSASYAAQLGKPTNVGVIAAKFFSEFQFRHRPIGGLHTLGSVTRGAAASASRGGALSHDVGTEFGERQRHEVTQVHFMRDREVATVTIEYASEAQLRKAGILPPAEPQLEQLDAFPGDRTPSGPGCKPPANWKGGRKPAPPKRKLPGRPSRSTVKKVTAKKTTAKKTTARRRSR